MPPPPQSVVEACRERVAPVVNVLLPSLFEKLGDNKVVVRQASLRCLGLLMRYVDKNPALIASIFGFFQHRNRHLRESAVKALIFGLIHGSLECNVDQIVSAVCPLLGDGTAKARRPSPSLLLACELCVCVCVCVPTRC